MAVDEAVFRWINNLAGNVWFIDEVLKGIANDYVIIVGFCLLLLVLWFGTKDINQREANQKAVICALPSLGVAQAFVSISNAFYFRIRPFYTLSNVNLLFYEPTDSSFPSNAAAIVFAIAFAIFLTNRRAGSVFLTLAIIYGFSRIYVGIHYPLDILTSVAIGFVTACLFHYIIKFIEPWPSRLIHLIRYIYLA
jgi:undecaprenyl-diphosphatase